jgi:GNAT superfamily N-acetyltransferase
LRDLAGWQALRFQRGGVGRRLRAAIGIARVSGLRGVLALARSKLYWHGRFVRFHVDLETWRAAGGSPGPGVEVRRGTLAQLARHRRRLPGLPRQFYMDHTHGFDGHYLGLVDGRIGHITWVLTSAHDPLQMRLGPGDIMLDGVYTLPEFRGRGLLAAVERVILDDAKRQGRRHAYTHVSHDNVASLRGVMKAGFHPVGVLDWRWVLGTPRFRYERSPAVRR